MQQLGLEFYLYGPLSSIKALLKIVSPSATVALVPRSVPILYFRMLLEVIHPVYLFKKIKIMLFNLWS